MTYTTTAPVPLGQKAEGSWPATQVGVQVAFPDLDYSSTATVKPTLSGALVCAQLVKSTGASALVPGTWAKWGVPGKSVSAKSGASDCPAGLVDPYLTSNVAQNEYFWLIVDGPAQAVTGEALSAAGPVISDANGKLAAGSESVHWGRMLEAASGADVTKRLYVVAKK